MKIGDLATGAFDADLFEENCTDLESAKERALKNLSTYKSAQCIVQVVAIVRPGAPVWDAEPAQQPAAHPAPFAVGDVVEVNDTFTAGWEKGKVMGVDSSGIPYFVRGANFGRWFRPNEVRRPAAEPKPFEFYFGQRVRVGKDVNRGNHADSGCAIFAGVEPTGNYAVLIEKYRDTIYLKPDQVFPL